MTSQNSKSIDRTASTVHDVWAHWMRYMFSVCTRNEDGSITIPSEAVERWSRQVSTDFLSLTEEEKESDRNIVRQYQLRLTGQKKA